MKNMSAEWQARLKNWLYALRQDLYRPLGAVPLEGFLTMEELAPREASARAFSPMRPGTKWGRSYEYCWLRGRVTLPPADGEAGLLLSYNAKSFSGITADASTLHLWHEGKQVDELPNPYGRQLWLRIVNRCNTVTLYAGRSPRRLRPVGTTLDVSAMHHNVLGSFMSLRPAWKRSGPDCTVDHLTVTPDAAR